MILPPRINLPHMVLERRMTSARTDGHWYQVVGDADADHMFVLRAPLQAVKPFEDLDVDALVSCVSEMEQS